MNSKQSGGQIIGTYSVLYSWVIPIPFTQNMQDPLLPEGIFTPNYLNTLYQVQYLCVQEGKPNSPPFPP